VIGGTLGRAMSSSWRGRVPPYRRAAVRGGSSRRAARSPGGWAARSVAQSVKPTILRRSDRLPALWRRSASRPLRARGGAFHVACLYQNRHTR